jgi:acetylornithine deacetylase
VAVAGVDEARAAAERIDEARLVRLAQDLVRIDTDNPPGNETSAAQFLADYLGGLGLQTELEEVRPGRANVIARLGSPDARPHLILNGHTDTVPSGGGWQRDPHGGEVVDGVLYGRGSADMKGGIAAMVAAIEAIVRSGLLLRGRLTFMGVMDEEETQDGTRFSVQRGLRGDFAIIAEPTDLRPVICHKGSAVIEVETRGVEAHGSTPEAGVSAIDAMAEVIAELRGLAQRLKERSHPLLGSPSLNVGTVHGGLNPWTVPGSCRIQIDRRLIPPERVEDAVREVQEVVAAVAARQPDFRAEARLALWGPYMEIPPDSPVVNAVRAAATEILGADPGVHGLSGTCDSNILVNDGGTPTVVFGPGSVAKAAHRPNESVDVAEMVSAARVIALAAVRLLS